MKQTAVEWLEKELNLIEENKYTSYIELKIKQAKTMETKERLKHQLFIGKVTEILGFDKTVELLKQCNDEIR